MIRQENVTSRDLELLNVALDHALTPQEQVEFNRRLSECPYLTTLYQEQRHLKDTMAQLPCRKVPHNFTLTRAEARKAKRATFLQPMFGWASAISALLVAVIFGSELIFRNVSLPAPMSSESPQVFSVEEDTETALAPEEAASMLTVASEPIYLLNWGYGATGMGGIGGKGGGGDGLVDSGGFSVNISISPEAAYAEDIPLDMAGAGEMIEGMGLEGMIEEPPMEDLSEVYPEETMLEEEPLMPETVMSTPVPVEREAPKIYGINPETVGTILKVTPDSSTPQTDQLREAQASAAENSESKAIVPTQLQIGLLAAAIIFGLIWLILKLRR